MGWKNWSYWLRGGIVGLIIVLIWAFFVTYISPPSGFADSTDAGALVIFILTIPGIIIGMIVGLIVGKIKSRKSVSEQL